MFSSPWSRFKGGGQIAAHQLASALAANGCEVHAIYSRQPGDPMRPAAPYRIHWVRRFDCDTVNPDIFSFYFKLRRLLARERFDVVHGNAEEFFFLPDLARRHGAAAVFTSHAPSVPTQDLFATLKHPIRLLKTLNPQFLRSAAARSQHVVTFSEFSRQQVLGGLGGRAAPPVSVVRPGVDPSWFAVSRRPDSKPLFLFWGRVEAEKGLFELQRAFQGVVRRFPDARVTVVGEGHCMERLKELSSRPAISSHLDFPGWLEPGEIQALAAKAWAGVFASHVESFGLSVAEAQAAGLPVIASRAGALPELVEDGVTGRLVLPMDANALEAALLEVLRDRARFETLAERGREAARERYSWDRAAKEMIALYRAVRSR